MGRAWSLLAIPPFLAACATSPRAVTPAPSTAANAFPVVRTVPDLDRRIKQLPRTVIDYDHALLDDNDRQVLAKLIDASRLMDSIYYRQVAQSNATELNALQVAVGQRRAPAGALGYFEIMKGPWDRLGLDQRFVVINGDSAPKPPGAGFYPTEMTKDDFEHWIQQHPSDGTAFRGLFTVIRRTEDGRLHAVPYSSEYGEFLVPAAQRLREAAALTKNASLRDYLSKRASAFLSDDYYPSDLAWMDLDSDIEVVIGPYEVYEDELFNYKASFESFVTAVDRPESQKLSVYVSHLPDMERNLPIDDRYKNPNRGAESPIRVVQEIFTAGDARRGVQTSAFNLPNDERVREAKGSKKVLLKNVMEAKFRQSGLPVAQRVLDPSQLSKVGFDPYFNHTLFHELSHGLGPGIITGPDGKKQENRIYLKELYSTIEECKADVLGVWNLLYAIDHGLIKDFDASNVYATYTGLMFRGLRFGVGEAHGRGTAVQWNWLREKGAIAPAAGGRFAVASPEKMQEGVRSLANELLMIEATGDYDRAKRLLDTYGTSTREMQAVDSTLADIPVDITPVFPAAGEK